MIVFGHPKSRMMNFEVSNSNARLAVHLANIAAYYKLSRDTYRHKTFIEAAKLIEEYPFEIASGAHARQTIPRVGPSLIQVIDEFLTTGTSDRLDELEAVHKDRKDVLDQFLKVYGIGPALANQYYDLGFRDLWDLWFEVPASLAPEFGLSMESLKHLAVTEDILSEDDFDELSKLCEFDSAETSELRQETSESELRQEAEEAMLSVFYRTLKSLATKSRLRFPSLTSAQKLGLEHVADLELKIPREEMVEIETTIKKIFEANPEFCPQNTEGSVDWLIAGSYRRGEPESGDVDVLIKSTKTNLVKLSNIVEILTNEGLLIGDLARGPTKYMGILKLDDHHPARRIDILILPEKEWAFATLYFTGSARFNVLTRQRAIDMGLRMNEHGIVDQNGHVLQAQTEEDIFDILGITYLSPEERAKNIPQLM